MLQIHGYGDDLEIEKGIADQIEKLICYAIDKKVKVLDLDLKGCNGMYPDECYDMPDVLSSHYLTYLKLSAFDITSCTTINLKSLSVLLLDEVILSDDVMEEIFLGCPFLENLSLADCCGLKKLICRNPNLKKVMVSLDLKEYGLVVISCPCVLSFEIYGWIQRADIVDVSSVVDASIFFNILYWCDQTRDDVVSRLLKMFSRCKTFSLCTWSILALTVWNFTNAPCPSFEWKNVILKHELTKWHLPGLSLLLKNSQCLETLTIYIYPFKFAESKWIEAHEFDGETYLDSQVDAAM